MKIISRNLFEQQSSELAKNLLGKILCRKLAGGQVLRKRITVTEAYGGFDKPDSASHAFRGKTKRNAPMFEKGGTIYVYLCYGIFNLLNIVSGKAGDPQGVLICGVDETIGSGRVSKLLQIERSLSGQDIINNEELWLEDDGFKYEYAQIECLPRVGIGYASSVDQARPVRFRLRIN